MTGAIRVDDKFTYMSPCFYRNERGTQHTYVIYMLRTTDFNDSNESFMD